MSDKNEATKMGRKCAVPNCRTGYPKKGHKEKDVEGSTTETSEKRSDLSKKKFVPNILRRKAKKEDNGKLPEKNDVEKKLLKSPFQFSSFLMMPH